MKKIKKMYFKTIKITKKYLKIIDLFQKEKVFSKCIYCGKEAREVVYFAKAY